MKECSRTLVCSMLLVFPVAVLSVDTLSGQQLSDMLPRNTITGVFPDEGEIVEYWEVFGDDGMLYGKDEKHSAVYKVPYLIKDDGCLHLTYTVEKWNGCYYFKENGDGTLEVTRPYTDEKGTVNVLKGDPHGLLP